MSYCFDMGFVPADSFEEALYKAQAYVSLLETKENIEKIVKNEKMFLKGNRSCGVYKKSGENKSEILQLLIQANENSILNFCTLNFVYFKKAKLLGLVGCNYPEIKSFTDNKICFQNSCDQDYERKDWQNVDYFLTIFDKWQKMPEKNLKEAFPDCNQSKDAVDYLRRYAAYQEIFREMHLEEWLYDLYSPDDFERFSLSCITNQKKEFLVWSLAKEYLNKELERR